MLYHVSIEANDPHHVASVIAELWQGEAFAFPPIAGAWIAMAGDERRTAIEVYPAGTVMRESAGDADAIGELRSPTSFTSTHAAIATVLDRHAAMAIAEREGWPTKFRKRGGMFGVIVMWIEGRQMMEVLTPEMQAEYEAAMTNENWRNFLASLSASGSAPGSAFRMP